MATEDEKIQIFVKDMVTGPYDLVLPEHRLDEAEGCQWLMDYFVNPTRMTNWDGHWLINGFETDTAKHAYYKFEPKNGDVLVASYAKTGTTWTTEIVRNILFAKDQKLLAKAKRVSFFYSYLEFGPVDKYRSVDNLQVPRRFLGTHLPAHLINLEKLRKNDTKILYVIRNPKDQAVSWYHFALTLPCAKKDPWNKIYPENMREFLDIYLRGQQRTFAKEGEGYLEHVREWYEHRNDSNVMILFYEEMKQNIFSEVRRIAKFLDVELSDEEVKQIVKKTSFKTMSEDDTVVLKFMRKGQIGDWKNHLTVAESEMIDANVEKVLGNTDIKFTYE